MHVERIAAIFLLSWPALAQQPGQPVKKPESVAGCVTASTQDKGKLVLKSKGSCSELSGKAAVLAKLAGHRVVLDGVLEPAVGSDPETLTISTVNEVGTACSETCTLEPPGSRGLGRKKGEVPGKVGGTAGYGDTSKPKGKEPPQ